MKELVLGLSKKISKEPEVASESIEEGSMAGQVSQEGEKVSTLTQMEVLTEYFGFCPIDFVDDIINAVNDLLYKAMDELEKLIRQEIKDEDLIEKGMTAVETLFESAIDKYFDKFELYCMSQIFVLPHEGKVVLPHYEGLDMKGTQEEETKLDEEITAKRHAILRAKYLNYKMTHELETLEECLSCLTGMQEKLRHIEEASKFADQELVLKNSIDVLAKNMVHMKTLSSRLRKRTLEVHFKSLAAQTDERTRYLKSSIASYLENQSAFMNQSLMQTPRKRRLSRLSLGPGKNTPGKRKSLMRPNEPTADCSAEYRGAMSIGTARSVQILREMLENEFEEDGDTVM